MAKCKVPKKPQRVSKSPPLPGTTLSMTPAFRNMRKSPKPRLMPSILPLKVKPVAMSSSVQSCWMPRCAERCSPGLSCEKTSRRVSWMGCRMPRNSTSVSSQSPAFLRADASRPSQVIAVFFSVIASNSVPLRLGNTEPSDMSSSHLNSLKSSSGALGFASGQGPMGSERYWEVGRSYGQWFDAPTLSFSMGTSTQYSTSWPFSNLIRFCCVNPGGWRGAKDPSVLVSTGLPSIAMSVVGMPGSSWV
ncbi:hypothetical protein B0T26DRAFT_297120 [Lasiosphaeria miniovina]|uniref:Uncharacterized protein n=1 Tax=Lasiosphaeria miniovina TaxID=1954250 RepID=A0AA40AKF9_9PEZI|nr:uncharacterized protein B0T26DRAFT_297120 [Lasiosphaeria miniovina]KAK0717460.1 hypothetical protein B0T26DRAFT_297120 [Lasiosphaeria miniovina]